MGILWESTLDNRYKCTVIRKKPYIGQLSVIDQNGDLLLSEEVGLMYDSVFGPDISDLNEWQERCLRAVPELD